MVRENPIAAQGWQRSAVELSCETTTPQGSTTWSLDRARRTNASRLRRCQCDSEPFIIEAWLEKDALAGVFEDLLVHYRVTLNVGRGGVLPTGLAIEALQWAARQLRSYDHRRPWRTAELDRIVRSAFFDGLMRPREPRWRGA